MQPLYLYVVDVFVNRIIHGIGTLAGTKALLPITQVSIMIGICTCLYEYWYYYTVILVSESDSCVGDLEVSAEFDSHQRIVSMLTRKVSGNPFIDNSVFENLRLCFLAS